MEKLPQKSKAPTTSLILSEGTKAMSKAMVAVNDCLPFKLEGEEILRWSMDVQRLWPEAEPGMLAFLIDQFKTEELVWDKTKGIQNIFRGLQRIRKTETGYKLLRDIYS